MKGFIKMSMRLRDRLFPEGNKIRTILRKINVFLHALKPSNIKKILKTIKEKGFKEAWNVITNKVGDIVSYLDDGKDAILYDEPTAEACMKAIKRAIRLKSDEKMRLSKNAYENAEIKFNYHLCSNELNRFFLDLR